MGRKRKEYNKEELTNKIIDFLKTTETKYSNTNGIANSTKIPYMVLKFLLFELATKQVLKYREYSISPKYIHRLWYLPENEDVVPDFRKKLDVENKIEDEIDEGISE